MIRMSWPHQMKTWNSAKIAEFNSVGRKIANLEYSANAAVGRNKQNFPLVRNRNSQRCEKIAIAIVF